MRKWLNILPYVCVAVIIVLGVQSHLQTKVEEKQNPATILPVNAAKVEMQKYYETTHVFSGYLQPYTTSELGFERQGRIVEVYAVEGSYVKKGAHLAKLSTSVLEITKQEIFAKKSAAQAKLKEMRNGARQESVDAAKAIYSGLQEQVSLAQRKLSRLEVLYAKGSVAIEEYETTQSNLKVLKTAKEAAHKQLEELLAGTRHETIEQQQALVQNFEIQLEKIDIHIKNSLLVAPHSGVVAIKKATVGKFVLPGELMFRVVETKRLKVKIAIPVSSASQIKIGDAYDVNVANRKYQMVVAFQLPEIERRTSSMVFILVVKQQNIQIFPGQLARLHLKQKHPKKGFWLPITALVKGNRGLWSCLTLAEDNSESGIYTVRKHDINVVYPQGNRIFVNGNFTKNMIFIQDGVHRVTPSQKVRIVSQE